MGRNSIAAIVAFGLMQPCFSRAQDAVADAVQPCWSCHGAAGSPTDATIPIIWGQRADYLEAQLRAYRSGDRENQIMNSMAESLKRSEIAAVAALIAAKDWPKLDAAASAPGPESVSVRRGCHGADLTGGASPVGPAPRLAGQNAAYLRSQMVAFAHDERPNQPVMSALMKALNDDDQAAVAAYLSSIDPKR